MRWLRFITGILLIVFLLFLAAFNVRLYSAVPPTGTLSPDVIPHLRFLRQALDEGVGEEMQQFFPEGYFFSYLLYGLTWVDTGLQLPDSSQERQEALSEARWALAQLDSLAGRSAFPESLDPPYGMFYNAWRSYLLAGILLLQPAGEQNPAELAGFQNQTAALAAALQNSSTPFVASYTRQSWPVDTLPALVALRGHTHIIDDRYEPLISEWLEWAFSLKDPAQELRDQQAPAPCPAWCFADGATRRDRGAARGVGCRQEHPAPSARRPGHAGSRHGHAERPAAGALRRQ
jgi:hypothetical protein